MSAQEPKISDGEAVLLILFALLADLLNWIPGINILITLITLPILQFYFIVIKRIKSYYSIAGNILELIPVLSILPAITGGVVATILLDRKKARSSHKSSLKKLSGGKNKEEYKKAA